MMFGEADLGAIGENQWWGISLGRGSGATAAPGDPKQQRLLPSLLHAAADTGRHQLTEVV